MKFCLLVTVALDIFIKEKKWYLISSLEFSFVILQKAKGVYSVKLSGQPPPPPP